MKKTIYIALLGMFCGWILASEFNLNTGRVQAEKSAAGTSKFELVSMPTGKAWGYIRYNKTTGQTVKASGGDFQAVNEIGAIPTGDYEVQLVPIGDSYALTRIEKSSGRTWYYLGGDTKFAELVEPKKPTD